jgi:hypothetical protein
MTTRHLIITDRCSKQQSLLDTCSDLSLFLHKLFPQCKERINFNPCAANGTTIPTYRWPLLSLNLGLWHDFTCRFMVVDITHPLIGADFLSHFGLLVDCSNNYLVDGAKSPSALIQAESSPTPSIKVNSDGTLVGTRHSGASAPNVGVDVSIRETTMYL